jgi:hypothetical protein
MIWHIFKKDVRLAWRLAAGLAGLHWTTIIVATMMFTGYPGLRNLAGILLLGGLAATGLLIVAVVQHDPIPARTGLSVPFAGAILCWRRCCLPH